MRFLVLLIVFSALTNTAIAQENVTWLSWKEGMALAAKENKKVIVSLHTDWCGWCKKMDSNTFDNRVIAQYINDNYIAIKFDAEQREAEDYKGQSFQYTRGGRRGYHTLAAKLTNGRLSYPSTVFLDENGDIIQSIPGFQDAPMMETILTYFAKDLHKSTPWVTYHRRYQPATKQAQRNNHTRLVGQKN